MSSDLLIAGFFVAGIVLGFLAWRGRVSWGWFFAALAGAAATFVNRLGGKRGRYIPPPTAIPGAHTATPILVEVNGQAEAEREKIREANEDPDEEERLKRLSELNNGGRE